MSLGVIGFQGIQHAPWMLRLTVLRAIMLIYNYFSAVGPCDWFLSCSLVVVKAVGQNGCYHIKPLFYCWVMNWKFLASNERTGGITKWNDANLVHWYFVCVCVCWFVLQATTRLRERGRDGCLAGFQVQQLFCSHSPSLPDQQLKELNLKINSALQVRSPAILFCFLIIKCWHTVTL